MTDFGSIDNILYFNVYDTSTKKLKYSKWNFKFDLYKIDNNLSNKVKVDVFTHFLTKNKTLFKDEPAFNDIKEGTVPSYLKQTVVKEELKKYFSPMTPEIIAYNDKYSMTSHAGYMNIQDPVDYKSITELVENQFDLKYYKMYSVRRLQDFYYSDKKGIFSKYNFDFNKYSEEYNVYGNNLVVFTDFISRVIHSSGSYIGAFGYGNPFGFKKYFIQTSEKDLIDYMSDYGVTSIWQNVSRKNEYTIDFEKYAIDRKIPTDNLENIKEHFYRWGQFKQLKLSFITKELTSIEKNMNSICNIYGSTAQATGFLYSNNNTDKNIYIVTAAHIVDKSNLSTVKASFSIKDNNQNNISTTAEFRIMGRDIYTDILVGVYDPELPYNKTFKPDLSPYKPLKINQLSDYSIGDSIYTIGSIGFSDNNSLLTGKLIDNKYTGDFFAESTNIPESLLIDMKAIRGISGSPIFKEGNDKEVIGMMIGTIKEGKYVIGLTSFILDNLVTNIIARWSIFKDVFPDDPIKLQFYTKNSITKRWLGAVTSYYNPQLSSEYNSVLSSFPKTGGIVLHDFYLGFNYLTSTFVFDTDSLTKEGVTQIEGPLLKSKLYNKFIDSGKAPIVITSMSFQSGLIGQYSKYEFGKYSNQEGFQHFYYGCLPIGAKYTPDGYSNGLVGIYGKIYIDFYYFNGQEWVFDTDEIYGDDEDSFTTYKDSLGNKFYHNKFDFPSIFLSYTESYIYKLDNPSGYGNGIYKPLGQAYKEISNAEPSGSIGLSSNKVLSNNIESTVSNMINTNVLIGSDVNRGGGGSQDHSK